MNPGHVIFSSRVDALDTQTIVWSKHLQNILVIIQNLKLLGLDGRRYSMETALKAIADKYI